MKLRCQLPILPTAVEASRSVTAIHDPDVSLLHYLTYQVQSTLTLLDFQDLFFKISLVGLEEQETILASKQLLVHGTLMFHSQFGSTYVYVDLVWSSLCYTNALELSRCVGDRFLGGR